MPELPEVENYRRYIDSTSMNRVIDDVIIKNEKILHDINVEEFIDHLITRRFLKTARWGKHLLIKLDKDIWLTMHFGMTGAVKFFNDLNEEPAHSRMLIKFEGKNYLSFDDQRLFGSIGLADGLDSFIKKHNLGIDALNLTDIEFFGLVSGKKTPIKTVLMKQELIAGIGNEYSDEILFQARINPAVEVRTLSKDELKRVFDNIGYVLKTAIDVRVRNENFPNTFILQSGRKNRKCPRCGAKMKCLKFSGRTGCFCPFCQID